MAHVRSSSALARVHPYLRKMAALIHRDDAVGIIAQRIIGSDSQTNSIVANILAAMWFETNESHRATVGAAIELFGWPIVREIAIVAMLHEAHREIAPTGINPYDLDRLALAVVTGGVQLGADCFASLLANIGIAGLAGIGGDRYLAIWRSMRDTAEDLPAAERAEFGFDHATLGAAMLWEADVPDYICRQVLGHCAPTSPIWAAEHIAYNAGIGGLRSAETFTEEHVRRLGLTEKRLEHIENAMHSAAGLPDLHFEPGAFVVAA